MSGSSSSGSDSSSSNDSGYDVKASLREDGKTDNYFGGQGKADGSGHGHAVVDSKGDTVYLRDTDGTVITDTKK